MFWQILLACIGSSGLSSLIIFLIQRKDNKEEELKKITDKLDKLERDSLRQQLLLLMSDYPSNTAEIMEVARRYKEIGGNWYVENIFTKFLKDNDIKTPSWFK